MLSLLQVVLNLRPGGLERVMVDLVNHLSPQVNPVICCLEEAGPFAQLITRENAPVIALGKRPGLDWRMVFLLAKLIRTHHIQVVHTHNAGPHLYGSIAGRLAGAKVIHTEHGKNLGDEARAHRVNRVANLFTDITVAVSEKIAREAIEREGVSPQKLVTIPNGIPVASYMQPRDRNALRRELGLPESTRLIGTVGRLVKEKNYSLLIRSFACLAAQNPTVHLVLIGDGPCNAALHSECNRLGLDDQATFLGQRSDIPDLLACLDVFVLSSSTEGMSIALLEAMATGCPIVVTAVGGNTELIEQEITGLVVPPDDETALCRAIARLVNDRVLAARLGAAACAKARDQYSIERMVNQYESLYRQLISAS